MITEYLVSAISADVVMTSSPSAAVPKVPMAPVTSTRTWHATSWSFATRLSHRSRSGAATFAPAVACAIVKAVFGCRAIVSECLCLFAFGSMWASLAGSLGC